MRNTPDGRAVVRLLVHRRQKRSQRTGGRDNPGILQRTWQVFASRSLKVTLSTTLSAQSRDSCGIGVTGCRYAQFYKEPGEQSREHRPSRCTRGFAGYSNPAKRATVLDE